MIQHSFQNNKPTLYIVSTPIGNLKDITLRALEVLREVDFIFAEDTRVSGLLLKHFEIKKPFFSYHEHNKFEQVDKVLEKLNNNFNVALISDAGTPLISDPGDVLIDRVIKEGFNVVPIPGASALLSSLVVSNMDLANFIFFGFLPRGEKEIIKQLEIIKDYPHTLVFYESPFRVTKTLKLLYEVFGNRKVFIAKEVTKLYETFIWDNLENYENISIPFKGEFVIIVEKNTNDVKYNIAQAVKLVSDLVKLGVVEKIAMKEVAAKTGISKNALYEEIKVKKESKEGS